MTEAVLADVVREKRFGVERAAAALAPSGARRRPCWRLPITASSVALFRRTWLTARLHAGVATAYFGYRVWARGDGFRTPTLERTLRAGLAESRRRRTRSRRTPAPPSTASGSGATMPSGRAGT